jgi:hypothetical protein
MERYHRQMDNFRCGPVAIYNTLKYVGFDISYNNTISYISDACNCATRRNSGGTDPIILRKVLRSFGIKHSMKKHLTMKDIDHHLKNNKAMILRYSWVGKDEERYGHFYLIVGKKNKSYLTVNLYSDRTISWRRRKTIVNTLISSSRKDEWCAWAWIIDK